MNTPKQPDDHALMQRVVRHHDAAAFVALYQRHLSLIRAFVRRQNLSADREQIEDVVQEAFLRAWAGRSRYVPTASVGTWLCAIAQYVVLEWQRQERRAEPLTVDLVVEDFVDDALADWEQSEVLWAAVAQLPPKQQEAIRLVYADGLTPTQAANKAHCTLQVLRWRLTDGRKQLRQLLAERPANA